MKNEFNGIVINHKPLSESALKRLLLIFDKIYFLHPDENNFLIPDGVQKLKIGNNELCHAKYPLLYNGKNYRKQEDQFFDSFNYAINKGIVRILDLKARKFYEKHWLPLRISYDFDSANKEILNNFLPLTEKNSNNSSEDGIIRGGVLPVNGPKIYPDIPQSVSFFSDEENQLFSLDHQLSSIAGKFNRLLVVSDEFNLIPIFINENLARAYTTKSQIAKSNTEDKLKKDFLKNHKIELNTVQYVLQRISEIILPDEIIDKIPIKELIIARNNSYQECIKLRRKLIKSLRIIEENRFDDEFLKEINNFVNKEINPLVNLYHTKFIQALSQFLKYSLPLGSVIGTSILGIQQSLSPLAVAYLSGVSGTAGQVTSELSQYIINRKSKKNINTYNYFIKLRE